MLQLTEEELEDAENILSIFKRIDKMSQFALNVNVREDFPQYDEKEVDQIIEKLLFFKMLIVCDKEVSQNVNVYEYNERMLMLNPDVVHNK